MSKQTNEINITQLLDQVLLNLARYIVRYKIILIVSLFLGVVIGSIIYYTYRNTYISTIVAKPNMYEPFNSHEKQMDSYIGQRLEISRYDVSSAANSINQFISNKKEFSKLFSISISDANKIQKISADPIKNTEYYSIKVWYEDGVNLEKFETGLVHYINNTKHIKSKIERSKNKNIFFVSKLKREVEKLEEFQESTLRSLKTEENRGDIVFVDKFMNFFHNDVVSFNILIQTCESNISTATAVDISQSLTFFRSQKMPLILTLIISTITFLILGIFMSIVLNFRNKI